MLCGSSSIQPSGLCRLRKSLRRALRVAALGAAFAFGSGAALHADDPYRGYTSVQRQATGWFRLEVIGGRHFFITPTGHPYLALSVCHLTVARLPGQAIAENLKAFHYTCAGYNVPADMNQIFPYLEEIYVLGPRKSLTGTGGQFIWHDVFDPAVIARNDEIIRRACANHRDNRMLVGYYFMDIPLWNLVRARAVGQDDYVAFMKRLGPAAPGKKAYVAFLQERHANRIDALNADYGTAFASFEDILLHPFPALSTVGGNEFKDDLLFEGVIAEQYYSTNCRAVRTHDPNHLILGDKPHIYTGEPNPLPDEPVLRAAGRHVDVFSVESQWCRNFTDGPHADYARIHEITGKPIMIGDGDTCSKQPQIDEARAERANRLGDYIARAFQTGYILGFGKCQYVDRPNTNSTAGIVNTDNTPRRAYTDIITVRNRENLLEAFKPISPDGAGRTNP